MSKLRLDFAWAEGYDVKDMKARQYQTALGHIQAIEAMIAQQRHHYVWCDLTLKLLDLVKLMLKHLLEK